MAKKKKNKFNKQKKSLKPAVHSQQEKMSVENLKQDGRTEITASSIADNSVNHEYEYVKKDIKKILIIIAVLLLLLIGVYILGAKTSVLNSFGSWIYKITNIKTQ